MAGPNNRTVDAATTEAMLRAFDTAQNESRTIRNGVLNAQGQLGAMWQGAASSPWLVLECLVLLPRGHARVPDQLAHVSRPGAVS